MAGIFRLPSRMDGGGSFGQWSRRSMGMNLPVGAGSQLDPISGPADSNPIARIIHEGGEEPLSTVEFLRVA